MAIPVSDRRTVYVLVRSFVSDNISYTHVAIVIWGDLGKLESDADNRLNNGINIGIPLFAFDVDVMRCIWHYQENSS